MKFNYIFKKKDPNFVLIDVRTKEERNISFIPTSIDITQFEAQLWTENDMNEKVFIPYCTIGYRSGQYAKKLLQKGFKNVKNGEGIILWTHRSSIPLVNSNNQHPFKLHTFGSKWNLPSKQYEAIFFSNIQMLLIALRSWWQ